MKKLYTILAAVLVTASTFAQAPEKMSYQAVVRDSGDALVTNQAVGMQISILQTTATGTAVYIETQTPTTNVNGLITLEIGTGSVVSGDFTTIDWSVDSYFIKTETDPAGGTTYTITGTSQLMSVPFALYAKTAGSATETQTLADVAILGNSLNTQLKNVTDPTDAQDAATKSYVDTLIGTLQAQITALEPQTATIGDLRAGGVVFWVDPADNTHGLVCAFSDYATTVEWGCFGTNLPSVPNVTSFPSTGLGAEIGDGMNNTNNILNDCPTAPAALAARSLGPEWFLPSAKELNQMYINKTILEAVVGFSAFSLYYWSSTEVDDTIAWRQYFFNGSQDYYFKDATYYVRAVRVF
jgi:hypothetical protein